ncbi:MAG: hypothetical protein ACOVN9_01675 [Inhella sp.]|jgi:hypothetical protein
MDASTQLWWTALCSVAALNVSAWVWSARRLHQGQTSLDLRRMQRLQLLLAAGYVLGCGYRSLLPVYDVPRICMVDSWASSVIVGRSVATVAELCFAAQWALLLGGIARVSGHRPAQWVARSVLPLIALAEVFSWTAVLTTANLGHVLEESLWGLVAVLLAISLIFAIPRCAASARPWLLLGGSAGLVYAAYMFGVDVPMYWTRWLADEAAGRPYLTLAQGLQDAATRWVVSHQWEHWRGEVIWMTLYFSVGVWISIGLAHVRLPAARQAE